VWITGESTGALGDVAVPWYHFRSDCGGLKRSAKLADTRPLMLEPTAGATLRLYRPCPACSLTTAISDICSSRRHPNEDSETVFATGFFGSEDWLGGRVCTDIELSKTVQETYGTVVSSLIANLLGLRTVTTLVTGVVFSGLAPREVVEDLNTVVTARWFSLVADTPSDDQVSLFWTLAIEGVQRGTLTHDVEELLFESAGLLGMASAA
jgi:hypothetical protein